MTTVAVEVFYSFCSFLTSFPAEAGLRNKDAVFSYCQTDWSDYYAG